MNISNNKTGNRLKLEMNPSGGGQLYLDGSPLSGVCHVEKKHVEGQATIIFLSAVVFESELDIGFIEADLGAENGQ